MDCYPHLNFLILTRLPLNLIWRLIGWSHRINTNLFNELLWKQKCQQEWSLLPTVVRSYRLYWLEHSWQVYGKLYIDGVEQPMKRPSQFYIADGMHGHDEIYVLTAYKELYRIDEGEPKLIADNIDRMIATGPRLLRLFYLHKDHPFELHDVHGTRYSFESDNLSIERIICLTSNERRYLVLCTNGALYLTVRNGFKFTIIGELFPGRLFSSVSLSDHSQEYQLSLIPVDAHIAERAMEENPPQVAERWKLILFNDYNSCTLTPMSPPIETPTLRMTFSPGSIGKVGSINVNTDGEGYLDHELIGRNKLRYKGICDVHCGPDEATGEEIFYVIAQQRI